MTSRLGNGSGSLIMTRQRVIVPASAPASTSPTAEGVYIVGADWQQRFDDATKTPYVWNNRTGEFNYDDPVSISYKREWANDKGMAGMMIGQNRWTGTKGSC